MSRPTLLPPSRSRAVTAVPAAQQTAQNTQQRVVRSQEQIRQLVPVQLHNETAFVPSDQAQRIRESFQMSENSGVSSGEERNEDWGADATPWTEVPRTYRERPIRRESTRLAEKYAGRPMTHALDETGTRGPNYLKKCFKCSYTGHVAAHCPEYSSSGELSSDDEDRGRSRSRERYTPRNRDSSQQRVVRCYNCGTEGHRRHECPALLDEQGNLKKPMLTDDELDQMPGLYTLIYRDPISNDLITVKNVRTVTLYGPGGSKIVTSRSRTYKPEKYLTADEKKEKKEALKAKKRDETEEEKMERKKKASDAKYSKSLEGGYFSRRDGTRTPADGYFACRLEGETNEDFTKRNAEQKAKAEELERKRQKKKDKAYDAAAKFNKEVVRNSTVKSYNGTDQCLFCSGVMALCKCDLPVFITKSRHMINRSTNMMLGNIVKKKVPKAYSNKSYSSGSESFEFDEEYDYFAPTMYDGPQQPTDTCATGTGNTTKYKCLINSIIKTKSPAHGVSVRGIFKNSDGQGDYLLRNTVFPLHVDVVVNDVTIDSSVYTGSYAKYTNCLTPYMPVRSASVLEEDVNNVYVGKLNGSVESFEMDRVGQILSKNDKANKPSSSGLPVMIVDQYVFKDQGVEFELKYFVVIGLLTGVNFVSLFDDYGFLSMRPDKVEPTSAKFDKFDLPEEFIFSEMSLEDCMQFDSTEECRNAIVNRPGYNESTIFHRCTNPECQSSGANGECSNEIIRTDTSIDCANINDEEVIPDLVVDGDLERNHDFDSGWNRVSIHDPDEIDFRSLSRAQRDSYNRALLNYKKTRKNSTMSVIAQGNDGSADQYMRAGAYLKKCCVKNCRRAVTCFPYVIQEFETFIAPTCAMCRSKPTRLLLKGDQYLFPLNITHISGDITRNLPESSDSEDDLGLIRNHVIDIPESGNVSTSESEIEIESEPLIHDPVPPPTYDGEVLNDQPPDYRNINLNVNVRPITRRFERMITCLSFSTVMFLIGIFILAGVRQAEGKSLYENNIRHDYVKSKTIVSLYHPQIIVDDFTGADYEFDDMIHSYDVTDKDYNVGNLKCPKCKKYLYDNEDLVKELKEKDLTQLFNKLKREASSEGIGWDHELDFSDFLSRTSECDHKNPLLAKLYDPKGKKVYIRSADYAGHACYSKFKVRVPSVTTCNSTEKGCIYGDTLICTVKGKKESCVIKRYIPPNCKSRLIIATKKPREFMPVFFDTDYPNLYDSSGALECANTEGLDSGICLIHYYVKNSISAGFSVVVLEHGYANVKTQDQGLRIATIRSSKLYYDGDIAYYVITRKNVRTDCKITDGAVNPHHTIIECKLFCLNEYFVVKIGKNVNKYGIKCPKELSIGQLQFVKNSHEILQKTKLGFFGSYDFMKILTYKSKGNRRLFQDMYMEQGTGQRIIDKESHISTIMHDAYDNNETCSTLTSLSRYYDCNSTLIPMFYTRALYQSHLYFWIKGYSKLLCESGDLLTWQSGKDKTNSECKFFQHKFGFLTIRTFDGKRVTTDAAGTPYLRPKTGDYGPPGNQLWLYTEYGEYKQKGSDLCIGKDASHNAVLKPCNVTDPLIRSYGYADDEPECLRLYGNEYIGSVGLCVVNQKTSRVTQIKINAIVTRYVMNTNNTDDFFLCGRIGLDTRLSDLPLIKDTDEKVILRPRHIHDKMRFYKTNLNKKPLFSRGNVTVMEDGVHLNFTNPTYVYIHDGNKGKHMFCGTDCVLPHPSESFNYTITVDGKTIHVKHHERSWWSKYWIYIFVGLIVKLICWFNFYMYCRHGFWKMLRWDVYIMKLPLLLSMYVVKKLLKILWFTLLIIPRIAKFCLNKTGETIADAGESGTMESHKIGKDGRYQLEVFNKKAAFIMFMNFIPVTNAEEVLGFYNDYVYTRTVRFLLEWFVVYSAFGIVLILWFILSRMLSGYVQRLNIGRAYLTRKQLTMMIFCTIFMIGVNGATVSPETLLYYKAMDRFFDILLYAIICISAGMVICCCSCIGRMIPRPARLPTQITIMFFLFSVCFGYVLEENEYTVNGKMVTVKKQTIGGDLSMNLQAPALVVELDPEVGSKILKKELATFKVVSSTLYYETDLVGWTAADNHAIVGDSSCASWAHSADFEGCESSGNYDNTTGVYTFCQKSPVDTAKECKCRTCFKDGASKRCLTHYTIDRTSDPIMRLKLRPKYMTANVLVTVGDENEEVVVYTDTDRVIITKFGNFSFSPISSVFNAIPRYVTYYKGFIYDTQWNPRGGVAQSVLGDVQCRELDWRCSDMYISPLKQRVMDTNDLNCKVQFSESGYDRFVQSEYKDMIRDEHFQCRVNVDPNGADALKGVPIVELHGCDVGFLQFSFVLINTRYEVVHKQFGIKDFECETSKIGHYGSHEPTVLKLTTQSDMKGKCYVDANGGNVSYASIARGKTEFYIALSTYSNSEQRTVSVCGRSKKCDLEAKAPEKGTRIDHEFMQTKTKVTVGKGDCVFLFCEFKFGFHVPKVFQWLITIIIFVITFVIVIILLRAMFNCLRKLNKKEQ